MGPTAVLMFLTVLLLGQQLSPCEPLRIATFNIQQLGLGKIRKNKYAEPLATFICMQDWDIAFLQELTTDKVLGELVNKLNTNKQCLNRGIHYLSEYSVGLPVVASGNKEIYAYIFRNSKIYNISAVVRQEMYQVGTPPTRAPVFFRPPFVADVHVRNNISDLKCMRHFVLIGIHARPARTYSELNGLVDVYDWAKKEYNENALILGDLNADSDYFGPVEKEQNVLVKRNDFKWLVEDRMKTNVGGTYAYDRIIAAGSMMALVANGNAKVPKWTSEVRLSDHYPVSVDLKCLLRKRRHHSSSSVAYRQQTLKRPNMG